MKKVIIIAGLFLLIILGCGGVIYTNYIEQKQTGGGLDYEDTVATSVGYLTIGWTVKKYDLPIDASGNVTFRCNLEKKYYVDENGVVHTNFVFDEEELLDKIEARYPDWASELQIYGGSVYLDAVMTCTIYENGAHRALGSMDEQGKLSGETYTTYEGIANARWWYDKTFFRTRYDIEVVYEATMVPEEPIEYQETIVKKEYIKYYGCDDNGVLMADLQLGSDEYDVDTAIPSGEELWWQTVGISGAHKLKYELTHIDAVYPVKVNVTQKLTWTDKQGRARSEQVVYAKWYGVVRSVDYCEIVEGTIYVPDYVLIEGEGIEPVKKAFTDNSTLIAWRFGGVKAPEYTPELNIDIGEVHSDNGLRPAIVQPDFSAQAELAVGQWTGRSQDLRLGQDIILDKNGYSYTAEPKILEASGTACIRPQARNGEQQLSAKLVYREYVCKTIDGVCYYGPFTNPHELDCNTINVWTPVIMRGTYVDNSSENQMLHPDKNAVELVLGNSFSAGISLVGNWGEEYKGYGYRDYSKYVSQSQVCFTFPVVRDGQRIEPGEWTELGRFILPKDVNEGKGVMTIRALAINYYEGAQLGYDYNEVTWEYGAEKDYIVEIAGQIKDFTVEDEWLARQLPKSVRKVKGDSVEYTFNTVGRANAAENISIVTSFYGIAGGTRSPLKLYRRTQAGYELYVPAQEISVIDSKNYETWFAGKMTLPADVVAVKADFDLPGYMATQLVFGDDVHFYRGAIVVNLDITTTGNGVQPLSYTNALNYKQGYLNRWRREGFIETQQYRYGDIAIFDLDRDYRQNYVIRGTH